MNMYRLLVIFYIIFLYGCFASQVTVNYCGRDYIEKSEKVYLIDEKTESNMIVVLNKKNKKIAFGYCLNAIRNDTNFISSKLLISNDTIINVTYHRYKITKGIDSSIVKYICTEKGILFHTYQAYWNGEISKSERFDRVMDN